MASDELSLTWNDHHNTLVQVFGKLLDTSSLVDCTIAAEGRYIKAHKIVLSACSPYFELLFNQENEKNPIVVLKDVKFLELKAIIDFVYSGKVRVPEDRLGDFVDAAESLQIKGLGDDSYETRSCERISEGSESPLLPNQEFSDSSSPVPRKRCKHISVGNVSEIYSRSNAIDEYQSFENVPQGHLQVDRLGHHYSSTVNASTDLCSTSVTVHSNQRIVETDSPVPFAEPLSPPPPPPPLPPPPTSLEMFPNPRVMVIKTEPEPLTEVFLPEMDFELKEEDDAEDTVVLESEGEIPGSVLNVDTQSSSNQYSAFPSELQTATANSDSAFLRTDVAEHSSLQGAAEAYARGGRRLSSTVAEYPADLSGGSVVESAHRHPLSAVATGQDARSTSRSVIQWPPRRHGCNFCGKTFSKPSELAMHLRKHTGDHPFKCEECGKAFTQLSNLQTHQRIHTRERPYKCEQCGKAFSRMEHMQIHQLIHTGERPFKCEECGKSFARLETMQAHQRLHTGERPFRCDVCGVTMANRGTLYRHKRGLHGEPQPAERRNPRC